MCPRRVPLSRSTMAASVVDLPEPVGPVTSMSPLGCSAWCPRTAGSPRSSSVGTVGRDDAQRRGQPARVAVDVDPEAAQALHLVREVDRAAVRSSSRDLPLVHALEQDLLEVLGREFAEADAVQDAGDADARQLPGDQVQVRSALLDGEFEERVEARRHVRLPRAGRARGRGRRAVRGASRGARTRTCPWPAGTRRWDRCRPSARRPSAPGP